MKKSALFTIVRVLITILCFTVLFYKMRGDLSSFVESIKHAHFLWFFIALALFTFCPFISVIRWDLLLRVQGVRIPFFHLVKYFFIGLFFNNFMLGLTGGDLIKGYYVYKETKEKKAEAVTTVLVDRIVGMFALIFVSGVALLFLYGDERFTHAIHIIFIVLGVYLLLGMIFMKKEVLKKIPFVENIYNRLPFRHTITKIYHALYIYRHNKITLFITVLLSVLMQVSIIIAVYLLGKCFGVVHVPFINYFVFVPVISVVSALPISVGGLGVGESAYVYFFNLIYEQSARYLAMALGLRVIMVLWSLVGGIFLLLPQNKISEEELEEVEKIEDQTIEEDTEL